MRLPHRLPHLISWTIKYISVVKSSGSSKDIQNNNCCHYDFETEAKYILCMDVLASLICLMGMVNAHRVPLQPVP